MKTLHEQALFPKDWLKRRMTRLVNKGGKGAFRPSVTLVDIANWLNLQYTDVQRLEDGRRVISDAMQIRLSQFFHLLDAGLIRLEVDTKKRKKTWVRAEPTEPPRQAPRPRIDFTAAKLRWD